MRVIKFKEHWDFKDASLVTQDKIQPTGLYKYWEAVNATFKYNTQRHELFLAKTVCMGNGKTQLKVEEKSSKTNEGHSNDVRCNETPCEDCRRENEMSWFFDRHRMDNSDQYHWNSYYTHHRQ